MDTRKKDKGAPAPDLPPKSAEAASLATVDQQKTSVGGYDTTGVGTGFEGFTSADLAVPFLTILQKGSPQVEEDNPKFVKGAKPGMMMNTVTNELYDGKAGVRFIPVHRVRSFIEWIPKDDGGGLVNVFEPNDPTVLAALKKSGKKFGKVKVGDNNDLVETFNVFGLLVKPDGSTQHVVLAMASSQIPVYKKWMTTAQSIKVDAGDGRQVTPPMFSHRYLLTTAFHQKKEYTWYKWNAAFDGPDHTACQLADTDQLCQEAKQFRALLLSGAAKANFSSMEQEAEVDGVEADM